MRSFLKKTIQYNFRRGLLISFQSQIRQNVGQTQFQRQFLSLVLD